MFSILRQCQIFVTSLRKAVKSGGELNEQGDGQRQRFSAGFVPGRQYIHKTRMVGCKLPTDTSMTCWAGQVSSMHRSWTEETTWHNTMMVINIKQIFRFLKAPLKEVSRSTKISTYPHLMVIHQKQCNKLSQSGAKFLIPLMGFCKQN